MEDKIAISCRGIRKSYGMKEFRVEALKGIDLDIHMGQLTLLVGPSGSGKTTLLSIITSILTPDAGTIKLLGEEIARLPATARAKFCCENLGIVFQSFFLIPTLTVAENVCLPLLIAGISEAEAHVKAIEMLKHVNIAHRSHVSPANLSKGQQQRVAIARAMVHDSKIIVCDEPTSALDQTAGHEIMTFLREGVLHEDRAVLVVTHDQRTFSFADRIVHMTDGQIIKEGKQP
jgi:putative ABC transport system ATP-binding protein